jgi:hypothetical protein
MGMDKRQLNVWIRLLATSRDRALLAELSRRNGDAGLSATVRRLIRQEAERQNLDSALAEQLSIDNNDERDRRL